MIRSKQHMTNGGTNGGTSGGWWKQTRMLVAAAGLAIAPVALGVNVDDNEAAKEHQQGFDRPLNGGAQGNAQTTTTVIAQDGNHEYRYESKNGVVRVLRDGKEVPKEQYRERGSTIEFLDGAGNVDYRMQLPKVDAQRFDIERKWNMQQGQRARGEGLREAMRERERALKLQGDMLQRERPPVMLGVAVSTNDDEIAKGLVIEDVNEDGPADKAGIKAGDRILSIEKKGVNTLTDLRAMLKAHKPGDKVDVTVDRDGQERIFTVELVKFEEPDIATIWDEDSANAMNERLQNLMGQQPNWLDLQGFTFTERDVRDMKMVEEELEKALEAITAAKDAALTGEQRAQLSERLSKALEGVKRVREIQSEPGNRARGMIIRPPAAPTPPRAGQGWGGGGDESMRELQEQLREMRQQLEEMRRDMRRDGDNNNRGTP